MSKQELDFSEPIETINEGFPVRILCTDGPSDFPIIGLFDGEVFFWNKFGEGRFYNTPKIRNKEPDLVEELYNIIRELIESDDLNINLDLKEIDIMDKAKEYIKSK